MIKIEVTDAKHVRDTWIAVALVDAVEAIKKLQDKHPLPGMALAISKLEVMAAEAKSEMQTKNIIAAMKGGIDLGSSELSMDIGGGKLTLVGRPMDLVEQAESGS